MSRKSANLGVLTYLASGACFVTPAAMGAALAAGGFDPAIVPTLDPVVRARAPIRGGAFRTSRLTGTLSRVEVVHQDKDEIRFGVLYRGEPVPGHEVSW